MRRAYGGAAMRGSRNLLERATDLYGSRYRLAKVLHEDQGYLSRVANGIRPIGPSLAARLAEHVGIDARDAALAALIAHEVNPVKRVELARIFGLPAVTPAWLRTNPQP